MYSEIHQKNKKAEQVGGWVDECRYMMKQVYREYFLLKFCD